MYVLTNLIFGALRSPLPCYVIFACRATLTGCVLYSSLLDSAILRNCHIMADFLGQIISRSPPLVTDEGLEGVGGGKGGVVGRGCAPQDC